MLGVKRTHLKFHRKTLFRYSIIGGQKGITDYKKYTMSTNSIPAFLQKLFFSFSVLHFAKEPCI